MNDPWQHMLQALEPAYDELKDIMDSGHRVVPELDHIRTGWRITLKERFNKSNDYATLEYNSLDTHVEWADQQLKDWPGAQRTAWDMWVFKDKAEAEKFMTLFYLSWDK